MKNTSFKLLQVALCLGGMGLAMHAQGQMVVVNVGINQPAALVADAGNTQTSLCEGDTLTLGGNPTATGGTAPYTYAWSPSGSLSSASVANPLAMPSLSTTYNLQVVDANNCTSTSSATVNVLAAAVASFSSLPGTGLSVAFLDLSSGTITSWAWDFGDGGTSTQQNPVHAYATPGQYTVCLTVSNPGCSSTSCTTLSVVVGLENAIAIPGLQVFPNPYQGTTHIRFGMTEAAAVRLVAYDLSGKLVGTVFEGDLDAGEQTLHFSAADYGASAGVYMLRLQVGDAQATLRVHELR